MGPGTLYILDQYPKGYKFTAVEIGVAQAGNANDWCLRMPLNQLVLVDNCSDEYTFGNCTKKECLEEVGKVISKYPFTVFHNISSVEAAKLYPDEYFDFVYLDGDHTYNGVMSDLEAWKNKVRKGGYLSGHDYDMSDNIIPGFDYVNDKTMFEKYPNLIVFHVKPAVQNFCSKMNVVAREFKEGEFVIRRTW